MNIDRKNVFFWLVFLLPCAILVPVVFGFPRLLNSQFSDLEITHYPNILFIQQSIQKFGQIPLWNPHILNGYPFDGDPLSGLWYPPGWLSILLPLPFGINLTVLLHVLAGGIGTMFYLKAKGFQSSLTFLGAGLFMVMPNMIAHIGAGHVTFTYAVCITPWLLYSATLIGISRIRWMSIGIGLIILADIRWLPYSIALLIIEICCQLIKEKKDWIRLIKTSAISLLAGIAIGAVLLIPLAIFTAKSTRVLITSSDVLNYSLPPLRLTGLLFPVIGGAEWTIFAGGVLLSLGVCGIIFSIRHREFLPWSVGIVMLLIWSLGESIPGMELVARIPGINLTRVPARGMIAGYICMVFLSLLILQKLFDRSDFKSIRTLKLFIFASVLVAVSYLGFCILAKEDWLLPAIEFIIVLLTFIFVIIHEKQRGKSQRVEIMIISLTLASVFVFDLRMLTVISPKELQINQNIASILSEEPRGKIYSPTYSISQGEIIRNSFTSVSGVAPIQLLGFVKYLSEASGIPADQYSVVQPPLGDDLSGDSTGDSKIDFMRMRDMGVKYIISSTPIKMQNLNEVYAGDNIQIYKNEYFEPTPYLDGVPGESTEIKLIHSTPMKEIYQVDSENGGILHTGGLVYPGWLVRIDQKNADMVRFSGIFRAVVIPPGSHTVEFIYRPIWTYTGVFISFFAVLLMIFLPIGKKNG